MNDVVLEFQAVVGEGEGTRALSLRGGDAGHWQSAGSEISAILLDELMGLRAEKQMLKDVFWFGVPMPVVGGRAHYKLLRRIFPIVPGAPLLANINIAENIMLPALVRNVGGEAVVGPKLIERIEKDGEDLGLNSADIVKLPHMVTEEQRLTAMMLQAWLARPEVVIVSDAVLPWKECWPQICTACLQLCRELPGTAWLFLNAESGLPAEFSSTNLDPSK
jgi:hypothetical protein